jgi:pyruvate-formate lyase
MTKETFDAFIDEVASLTGDQLAVLFYMLARRIDPQLETGDQSLSVAAISPVGGHGSRYLPEELASIERLVVDKRSANKSQFRQMLDAHAKRFGRNANAVKTKVNETIRGRQ